jgi:hypothetical protein
MTCLTYPYFISLTTDNASVNDVVVSTAARCLLARYDIPFTPDMHIRCIAHVINLVVQAFLFGIDEGDDPELDDWYELNKDAPIHYDIDKDQEQRALDEEDHGDEEAEVDSSISDLGSIQPEEMDTALSETIEEVGKGGAITRVMSRLNLVFYNFPVNLSSH